MAQIGIVFGSHFGRNETAGAAKYAADYIASKTGADIINATDLTENFIASHEKLIFVASTHKKGELQEDFQNKLDVVKAADFSGKTLALVGLGGTANHADTFCDGLVEFLPHIRGAKLVGAYDDGGYAYKNSLAFINGKFVGLVLDVKADADWKARTDKWLESVRADFGFTY